MSRIRLSLSILSVLALLAAAGCDTPGNSPSPAANYFLKYYGADGYQTGVDVAINVDGTFVLFGTSGPTSSDQDAALFLVKADKFGNVIWRKTFGGTGNQARDVEILADGGIVTLSNHYSKLPASLDRDIVVSRFSQDGVQRDTAKIAVYDQSGTVSPFDKDAQTITQLANGDFIIAGSTYNLAINPLDQHLRDGMQVKVNGTDLSTYSLNDWTPVIGPGQSNYSVKVFEYAPDNYLVFGYSDANYNGSADLNFTATQLNSKGIGAGFAYTWGAAGSDERLGAAVLQSSDATGTKFRLAGYSTLGQNSDMYLASLVLSGGNIPSNYPIPATPGISLKAPADAGKYRSGIAAALDGGFFVLANERTEGNSNLLLIKLDDFGSKVWSRPVVYGGAGEDFCGSVRELPDGKIIVMGTISVNGEAKMAMMKVNKDGLLAE